MLTLTIPKREIWDEANESFIYTKETVLQLEHSLISVSKWEAKWHEPFMNNNNMTPEKTMSYIQFMTMNKVEDPLVYSMLTKDEIQTINDYIDNPMTATWFAKDPKKHGISRGEIITSEVLYFYMVSLQIPFQCEKWHLNRLITLIKVCSEKNKKPDKMSKRDIMNRNRALNEARKAKMGTKG